MKYRKLRIAWSVLCGVLCLLLIALWMRSYWRADSIQAVRAGSTIWYETNRGVAFFCVQRRLPPVSVPPWSYSSTSSDNGPTFKHELWLPWGPTVKGIQSPLWLPIVSLAVLAGTPWSYRLRRFSLRTLLIGMTVVAAVLGLAIALRGS
jgi:hypothetical protein